MIVPLIQCLERKTWRKTCISSTNSDETSDNYPHLSAHAGLLQQILLDLGSFDGASLVEVDVDVLPEAAGVVVADGLCIAKGLFNKDSQGGGSQTKVMQFWMHFPCTTTDPPEWVWPPGPAARSRSVGRWWLPGTAGLTWCSPSFQLQTRRWKTKQNETNTNKILAKLVVCAPPGSYATWWCSTGPCCCAACWSSSCLRWRICAAAFPRSSCWCRGGSDPECRWGAAGRGWRPPGWSRCTSAGSTQHTTHSNSAVKFHSPLPPLTCRHFLWDVRFDCNLEKLVPYMKDYYYESNQSRIFRNAIKPNYFGKTWSKFKKLHRQAIRIKSWQKNKKTKHFLNKIRLIILSTCIIVVLCCLSRLKQTSQWFSGRRCFIQPQHCTHPATTICLREEGNKTSTKCYISSHTSCFTSV